MYRYFHALLQLLSSACSRLSVKTKDLSIPSLSVIDSSSNWDVWKKLVWFYTFWCHPVLPNQWRTVRLLLQLCPLDLPQRLESTIAGAYLWEDTFKAAVDSRTWKFSDVDKGWLPIREVVQYLAVTLHHLCDFSFTPKQYLLSCEYFRCRWISLCPILNCFNIFFELKDGFSDLCFSNRKTICIIESRGTLQLCGNGK